MRDEGSVARIAEHLTPAIVAGAALLVGYGADRPAGLILATTLIIIAALLERVVGSAHARRLWASPVAYPLLMLPLLALGQPLFALGLAALYAVVTLAVAIEGFLEKP